MTKININVYVNDQQLSLSISPQLTALYLIREQLGLTGAKESCAEGDCGSCTVAVGRWQDDKFCYQAVNSCIFPAVKLHGAHIITAEGLVTDNKLHLIQQLLLENHATQCGYCTPGIVMSLFALFINNPTATKAEIMTALQGNLCRCTGYLAIAQAAEAVVKNLQQHSDELQQLLLPNYALAIQQQLKQQSAVSYIESDQTADTVSYELADSLQTAFSLLAKYGDKAKIINGGTDLMVAANIHQQYHRHLIDISAITALGKIALDTDYLHIGGAVTLTQLERDPLIAKYVPVVATAVSQMASTQIRNVATAAGNIANASPIADLATVLLGLDASLILANSIEKREIALDDFYCGYKETALAANEIITVIKIPVTSGYCSFEKLAKRNAVDIATASSLLNIITEDQVIKNCRIAFGGVAPYPALAIKTAEFLTGQLMSEELIAAAADIVAAEFAPISDVRGSKEYRTLLIRNQLLKHFQGLL